jgi:hypothetical protein
MNRGLFLRHLRTCATLLLAGLGVSAQCSALHVVYPQGESPGDERLIYPRDVLRMALEHSGEAFTLQASEAPMQQDRALLQLRARDGIDIVWTTAARARDLGLRRVPVPIDRGLIGWRLLLIRAGDEPRFAAMDSLAGLARLLGGQGHDWPDLRILSHNGLRVTGSQTYEGLFAMLARGHIDYLPRGVSEVGGELARHGGQSLAIEPRLMLVYPSALYFFVNQDDEALAATVQRGLDHAIADGSLQRRFEREYGALLARLTRGRRVLHLENPFFPPSAASEHPELWLPTP